MNTRERRDYFGRLALELSNTMNEHCFERARRESIDYFLAVERFYKRGDNNNAADRELLNGDIELMPKIFGQYAKSSAFVQDANNYAMSLKVGFVPKKAVDFLSSMAEGYHREL